MSIQDLKKIRNICINFFIFLRKDFFCAENQESCYGTVSYSNDNEDEDDDYDDDDEDEDDEDDIEDDDDDDDESTSTDEEKKDTTMQETPENSKNKA